MTKLLTRVPASVYNVANPITVLLEPGIPISEELCAIWGTSFLREEGETELAFRDRCVERLVRTYERNGFGYTQARTIAKYMARVVEPVARDPGDVLMMPPDPPPRTATGTSPRSTRSRLSSGHDHDGIEVEPESPTPAPPAQIIHLPSDGFLGPSSQV